MNPIATKILSILAVAGVVNVAMADETCSSFTPVDLLSAQERSLVSAKISEIEKTVKIDWDLIEAGINEQGDVVLCPRKKKSDNQIASESCYSPW